MFDIGPFVFPIFSGVSEQDMFRVDKFLGAGFWIGKRGHFLTCKHVLAQIEPKQVAAIARLPFSESTQYLRIVEIVSSGRFDVAVGRAFVKSDVSVLPTYSGPIGLGLEVQAFGFADAGKEPGQYFLDLRLLRGHVTRLCQDSLGLDTPSVMEVSFGSPGGFSGTPLLVDSAVVGMLHNNLETKIGHHSILDVTQNGNRYKEDAYRVYEYGVAHMMHELSDFIEDACNSLGKS